MKVAKITCLILVDIALALMLFCPVFVNRHSHVHAFVAWRTNPTPETEARWNAENKRLHRDMALEDLALCGGLVVCTTGLFVVIRRRNTMRDKTSVSTSSPALGAGPSSLQG